MIMALSDGDGNLSDNDQARILDELAQFLIDMMSHCEQTLLAEPAVVAAHRALLLKRIELAGGQT
jgi:hypothetical protein